MSSAVQGDRQRFLYPVLSLAQRKRESLPAAGRLERVGTVSVSQPIQPHPEPLCISSRQVGTSSFSWNKGRKIQNQNLQGVPRDLKCLIQLQLNPARDGMFIEKNVKKRF